MKELTKVFNYGSYNIRTLVSNGEPWFVVRDVMAVLDITNVEKHSRCSSTSLMKDQLTFH